MFQREREKSEIGVTLSARLEAQRRNPPLARKVGKLSDLSLRAVHQVVEQRLR
jgi:hypothetical protein